MVPSSTASTSIVALSVSISAMMSPDLTVSPSFFSHLARLPFSIVGDSAGMRMLIGMASALLSLGGGFFRRALGNPHRTRAHVGGEGFGNPDRGVLFGQTGLLCRVDRAKAAGDLGQHVAPLLRIFERRPGRDVKLVIDDAEPQDFLSAVIKRLLGQRQCLVDPRIVVAVRH